MDKEEISQVWAGYLQKLGFSVEQIKVFIKMKFEYMEATERGSHPDLRV